MQEGVRVQASEVKTVGLAVDAGRENYGLSLGLEKQQRLRVATNAVVRLEWLTSDLFGVRAGTNFSPNHASNSVLHEETIR